MGSSWAAGEGDDDGSGASSRPRAATGSNSAHTGRLATSSGGGVRWWPPLATAVATSMGIWLTRAASSARATYVPGAGFSGAALVRTLSSRTWPAITSRMSPAATGMRGRLRLNSATWRCRGVVGRTASSSPGSASSGQLTEGQHLAEPGVGEVEEDRSRGGQGGRLSRQERPDVDTLAGDGGDRRPGVGRVDGGRRGGDGGGALGRRLGDLLRLVVTRGAVADGEDLVGEVASVGGGRAGVGEARPSRRRLLDVAAQAPELAPRVLAEQGVVADVGLGVAGPGHGHAAVVAGLELEVGGGVGLGRQPEGDGFVGRQCGVAAPERQRVAELADGLDHVRAVVGQFGDLPQPGDPRSPAAAVSDHLTPVLSDRAATGGAGGRHLQVDGDDLLHRESQQGRAGEGAGGDRRCRHVVGGVDRHRPLGIGAGRRRRAHHQHHDRRRAGRHPRHPARRRARGDEAVSFTRSSGPRRTCSAR